MNESLAIQFVREHGSAVEQARLDFLLKGEPAPAWIVAEFISTRRQDGAWSPFWAPDYSSADATCFHLAQAQQLGIPMAAPEIVPALDFLAGRQKGDGSWEEDPSIADAAPPWAKPGDPAATLYLTANCGYWLAAPGDRPQQAARAGSYLEARLAEDGRFPSFLQTHWLAVGLWHRIGRLEPAGSVAGYLESRLGELSAHDLTWMVTTLRSAGLPADRPPIAGGSAKLADLQQDGGRWRSDDGPDFDVHVTLEALFALSMM